MFASVLLALSLISHPGTVWWAERTVDPRSGWNATLQIDQRPASSTHVQVELWRQQCDRKGCLDIHLMGSVDTRRSVTAGNRARIVIPVTTVVSRDGGDDLHEISRTTTSMQLTVSMTAGGRIASVRLGRHSWTSTAAGVLVVP